MLRTIIEAAYDPNVPAPPYGGMDSYRIAWLWKQIVPYQGRPIKWWELGAIIVIGVAVGAYALWPELRNKKKKRQSFETNELSKSD